MYSNYNGDYVEGLIKEGAVNIFKKFNTIELMDQVKLDYYFEEYLEEAKKEIRRLDYKHWREANKHSEGSTESILDHFFCIDSVVEDKVKDVFIGVDWTLDYSKLHSKLLKHSKFKSAYELLDIDYVLIVYIKNINYVKEKNKDIFVKKTLQLISSNASKKGLSIDAEKLLI